MRAGGYTDVQPGGGLVRVIIETPRFYQGFKEPGAQGVLALSIPSDGAQCQPQHMAGEIGYSHLGQD